MEDIEVLPPDLKDWLVNVASPIEDRFLKEPEKEHYKKYSSLLPSGLGMIKEEWDALTPPEAFRGYHTHKSKAMEEFILRYGFLDNEEMLRILNKKMAQHLAHAEAEVAKLVTRSAKG